MNFDGFPERLKVAIGADTPYAFAKKSGISESLVRKYLAGDSLPSIERAWVMAKTAGVSLDWLAGGDGESASVQAPAPAEAAIYAYIPLYDARCSAGNGAWNEGAKIWTHLAFTRYSLQRKGLTLDNLSAIQVAGDSMEPLLVDGDTVLIDHSRNALEGEGIYVIHLDDHLYAKRLQRQFDGALHVISENKAYRDMVVPKERLDELQIIGRVVWAGGWV